MKKIVFALLILFCVPCAQAQPVDWQKVSKMIEEGSYRTAYSQAGKVYGSRKADGRQRLTAAFYMAQAGAAFEEDARDSAEARYRALLPSLEGVERAICYAFLGEADSALADTLLLQRTPVEEVEVFCQTGKTRNMTPTVFDLLVTTVQDQDYNPRRNLALQRRLCAFHAQDADADLRIWHDIRLLHCMENVPNQHINLSTIQQFINKHRHSGSELLTGLYALAANYCQEHEKYVQAVCYCDTAIALAPKSQGGVECANMRSEITAPWFYVDGCGRVVQPDQPSVLRVSYRNLDHLWVRVVPFVEGFGRAKMRQQLLKAQPLAAWDVALPPNDEYRTDEAYITLPALPSGRYLMLVSRTSSPERDGFVAYEVRCTDMALFRLGQGQFLLADSRTGLPIAGQEVQIDSGGVMVASVATDAEGRFGFVREKFNWREYIVINRGGYTLREHFRDGAGWGIAFDTSLRCELRVDRPIYRPADTLHVAAVAYHSNGLDAMAAGGCWLHLRLADPNGREVWSDSVLTDGFGLASATVALPPDGLAGSYHLQVRHAGRLVASQWLRVEEYRQPRFMVTLHSPLPVAFGTPCQVQGLAMTYSGVPVSGARVQYRVERELHYYWGWRRWSAQGSNVVDKGETVAEADGSFSISFVPQPDSSVELTPSVSFRFVVRVDVTDLNGESHEGRTDFRVGFRQAYIGFGQQEANVDHLDSLILHLEDINGNPLDGTLHVRVARLQRPEQVLMAFDAFAPLNNTHHTISREEWHRRFPLYAYDSSDIWPRCWPEVSTVFDADLAVRGGVATVRLPKLEAGFYKVNVSCEGAEDEEQIFTLTPQGCRRVQDNSLLWADIESSTAEVGQRLRLRFGSALPGTQIYYRLCVGDKERFLRRVDCSDDAIHTEYVAVDTSMLGDFTVQLFAVREGVVSKWQKEVNVPFSHKRLDMQITTFRDHLLPGQTEEWTIRVRSALSSVHSELRTPNSELSAVILTMYDDALNSFGLKPGWDFAPWRKLYTSGVAIPNFYDGNGASHLPSVRNVEYRGSYPTVWRLREGMPYHFGRRMYKANMAMARSASAGTDFDVEEVAEGVFSLAEDVVDAAHMVATQLEAAVLTSDDDGGIVLQTSEDDAGGFAPEPSTPQVRENLSPLAFFAADIRTDSTGTATYRFTLPDLLTRWNVRGMAYTKDLRVGTLDRTLVASKPLMVQPNLPRFLRHGDSLSLMAKVVIDEVESGAREVGSEECEVMLLLTDAATGDTLCYQTQVLPAIHSRISSQVHFDVEVPQSVHVAEYCITARCGGMSDGERGQIPVVTNRQTVSVSQALFINGVGEKSFQFPLSAYNSPTAEPQLLMAEVVSNPVWLAAKCMPYVSETEDPSSLYLANQLYVNSMGAVVAQQFNSSTILQQDTSSPLRRNEAVKQSPLEATPWLRAAQTEEEQMRAVARYFDSTALTAERDRALRKLHDMQNDDGGFPWMPEGRSSLWVTQQVLERISYFTLNTPHLTLNTPSALDFVDREHQQYYEKYVKPHAKKYRWQPTDVDYLYMRSFYGKGCTEAYRFYYANALKSYKQYDNLYTQAQLALVFHRGGDRKQALDLLRRLKEKSLSSDEMGLYWRDNRGGWFWYRRPIETQALLIRAFAEITPTDTLAIGQMQQWLLKQKQTTHWGNNRATAEAIGALIVESGNRKVKKGKTTGLVVFGDSTLAASHSPLPTPANPEGYATHSWTGDSLRSLLADTSSLITISKTTPGIAWGSVVYQYEDDMDHIPASDMGVSIQRSYLVDGVRTTELQGGLHVGDRVKVRIEIFADRAMDYLELIDGRPSCLEPLSTRAGWRWNDGLSYYVTVGNTDTRFYVEHLERGHYVAEYDAYVSMPGHFLCGVATMQCMYAPEFRANTGAVRMVVEGEK